MKAFRHQLKADVAAAISATDVTKIQVLQRVAACCSVLQRVAACCSVLQRVAACCSALQRVAVSCRVLQWRLRVVQCVADCVADCNE